MRFAAARVLLALLVIVVAGVVPGGIAGPAVAQEDGVGEGTLAMQVVLEPGGDARWTVTLTYTVDTPERRAAFDDLADEHTGGSEPALTVEPFAAAAGRAAEHTGRTMAIERPSRSANRDESVGRLVLTFTWTNFARAFGDRLVLGDVFHAGDGTWLGSLRKGQALTIAFPTTYAVQSSSHPLRNRSFDFEGPRSFQPGEPSATLVRQEPGPSPNGNGSPPESPDGPAGLLPSWGWGLAAAIVLGAIGFLLYRRWTHQVSGSGPPSVAGTEEPDEATAEGAEGERLLSDEERILRLLAEHDGRMKQAAIVEATDWSNAKVSQLLSEMAEAGDVEKLRIGRENLISLPDEGEE